MDHHEKNFATGDKRSSLFCSDIDEITIDPRCKCYKSFYYQIRHWRSLIGVRLNKLDRSSLLRFFCRVEHLALGRLLAIPSEPGRNSLPDTSGNTKGGMKYHCTIDLLFDWFGLVGFTNKNENCQLPYSWFQTSQTGGQQYSDTSPFIIPCRKY